VKAFMERLRNMSNCLFFAVALYLRRGRDRHGRRRERYLAVRASRLGTGPHFLYLEYRKSGLRIVSYKPMVPAIVKVPPPLFEGRAAWGDNPL
jgi:hypothetical protein